MLALVTCGPWSIIASPIQLCGYSSRGLCILRACKQPAQAVRLEHGALLGLQQWAVPMCCRWQAKSEQLKTQVPRIALTFYAQLFWHNTGE